MHYWITLNYRSIMSQNVLITVEIYCCTNKNIVILLEDLMCITLASVPHANNYFLLGKPVMPIEIHSANKENTEPLIKTKRFPRCIVI